MGLFLRRWFGHRNAENEDVILGCDMVPASSVLSILSDQSMGEAVAMPVPSSSVGPFTTMAEAPIRDS